MIDYNIVVNGFNTQWRIPIVPRRNTALLWVEGHCDIDVLTMELIPEMPRGHSPKPRQNRRRRVAIAFSGKFSNDFLNILDVNGIAERDDRLGINLALSRVSLRSVYSDLIQTLYPVVVRENGGDFTFYAHEYDRWKWGFNLQELRSKRVRVDLFDALNSHGATNRGGMRDRDGFIFS